MLSLWPVLSLLSVKMSVHLPLLALAHRALRAVFCGMEMHSGGRDCVLRIMSPVRSFGTQLAKLTGFLVTLLSILSCFERFRFFFYPCSVALATRCPGPFVLGFTPPFSSLWLFLMFPDFHRRFGPFSPTQHRARFISKESSLALVRPLTFSPVNSQHSLPPPWFSH